MGAVKAINAARLALQRRRHAPRRLDKVIQTMRQTGADMQAKYKETVARRPGGQHHRVLTPSGHWLR